MRASFVMSGVGQGLRRNLLMSVSLIMITFVSLYFLGGSLLSSKEIDKFRTKYEDKLNVSVYLCGPTKSDTCKHAFTPDEKSRLLSKLRADPQIAAAQFLGQQQIYKKNKYYLASKASQWRRAAASPNLFWVKRKAPRGDSP